MKSQKQCLQLLIEGRTLTDGKVCLKMSSTGIFNVKTKRKTRQCFTDFQDWWAKAEPVKLYAYTSGQMYQSSGGSAKRENIACPVVFFDTLLTQYAMLNRVRTPHFDIDYEMEVEA